MPEVRRGLPGRRLLLEALRRLGIVPEPVYRHLHFRGVFVTEVLGREIRLRSHGDQIENEVFWSGVFGRWEGVSLRLWAELAKEAEVILDVGANTGLYALVAQAANPSATVVAFEPVPRVFRMLAENVRLNRDTVRCVPAAVSDEIGRTTIYAPRGENPKASSLDPSVFGEGVGRSWEPLEVETVRLDVFLADEGLAPDLIKVDVEGHEPAVLRGLGEILALHRPSLLVEVLDEARAASVRESLEGLGYRAYEIDETEGPEPLPAGRAPTRGRNVLFCSPDTASNLGLSPARLSGGPV